MSAEVQLRHRAPGAIAVAQALYFNSGAHRLFGWLHRSPDGKDADIGVVICQPFGYEAICAHRGMRAFAEALAEAGMPSLRFDYLGTGDSPDIDREADQLQIWTQDVLGAVKELRRQTGVQRICLLGFRLGALLASLAATKNGSISALIGVSPIVSGKRYLRELRVMRLAASMGANAANSAEPRGKLADGMEVSGFSLAAATLDSLQNVDLSGLQSVLPQMLVINGATMAASGGKVQSLEAQRRTTHLVLPGAVEMLMTPPQFAQVPKEMIEASLDWLSKLPQHASASIDRDSRRQINATDALGLSNILALPGGGAPPNNARTEMPVFFGTDELLFGVLTQPAIGEIRRRAVILLNAGADHHIGASRLYVSMARRWAQHGYAVLRMDLGGVGDSGTRPGRINDDVFPLEAIDDIRAAIDFLRSTYGIRDVTLAGLCSGAYHALRSAVAGLPVNHILMVNPQNYFWRRGETLQGLQLAEVVHNPGIYRERMLSLAAWKKLFTGQVNIARIVKIYLQHPLLVAESWLRDQARRLHIRLPNDLGRDLEEVVARGVRVSFIFAQGEPGLELLKVQAGNSVKRLAGRCHIRALKSGDHVFTRSDAREIMENVVSDELFARPEAFDEQTIEHDVDGQRPN